MIKRTSKASVKLRALQGSCLRRARYFERMLCGCSDGGNGI